MRIGSEEGLISRNSADFPRPDTSLLDSFFEKYSKSLEVLEPQVRNLKNERSTQNLFKLLKILKFQNSDSEPIAPPGHLPILKCLMESLLGIHLKF